MGASFVWKSIYSSLDFLRRGTSIDVSRNLYFCHMSTNDIFSVRAAYNYIEQTNLLSSQLAEASSSTGIENFWKVIWRLDLPRKIKLFIWRAYNNGIPVGAEMLRKFGLAEAKCYFCNFHIESTILLFKDCWWFRALWIDIDMDESHLEYQFLNFADWLFHLFSYLPVGEFRKAIVTFWFSWYNRNIVSHDENMMDIHETKAKILLFIKRIGNARSVYQTHFQADSLMWIAPANDFVKINCDAAWSSMDSGSGIGVICRRKDTTVIACLSVALSNIYCALESEGLAMQYGMNLAKELGLKKVIFETDNFKIAELLWFGVISIYPTIPSWRDSCLGDLATHMDWQVQLIRREANGLADLAANHAKRSGTSFTSTDACPYFLSQCIHTDV